MPTIRTVLIDGAALAACCAGLFSIADGYARNLPGPPEQAGAQAWFDPITTGSIVPKDERLSVEKRGRRVRSAKAEAETEPSKGWVDPFYRKRSW